MSDTYTTFTAGSQQEQDYYDRIDAENHDRLIEKEMKLVEEAGQLRKKIRELEEKNRVLQSDLDLVLVALSATTP